MVDIIELIGAADLHDRLGAIATQGRVKVLEELRYEAEEIRRLSMLIVPVDTGRLSSSAFVRVVGPLSVEVGYSTEYAVKVHENPFSYHKSPTRYKYLEEPARDRAKDLEKRLGTRLSVIAQIGNSTRSFL